MAPSDLLAYEVRGADDGVVTHAEGAAAVAHAGGPTLREALQGPGIPMGHPTAVPADPAINPDSQSIDGQAEEDQNPVPGRSPEGPQRPTRPPAVPKYRMARNRKIRD